MANFISLFDGSEDPEAWLQSMEDYLEESHVSIEDYAKICISNLRGASAIWARENELIISRNWCAFCYNLLWKFAPSTKVFEEKKSVLVEKMIEDGLAESEKAHETVKSDSMDELSYNASLKSVSIQSINEEINNSQLQSIALTSSAKITSFVAQEIHHGSTLVNFQYDARHLFEEMLVTSVLSFFKVLPLDIGSIWYKSSPSGIQHFDTGWQGSYDNISSAETVRHSYGSLFKKASTRDSYIFWDAMLNYAAGSSNSLYSTNVWWLKRVVLPKDHYSNDESLQVFIIYRKNDSDMGQETAADLCNLVGKVRVMVSPNKSDDSWCYVNMILMMLLSVDTFFTYSPPSRLLVHDIPVFVSVRYPCQFKYAIVAATKGPTAVYMPQNSAEFGIVGLNSTSILHDSFKKKAYKGRGQLRAVEVDDVKTIVLFPNDPVLPKMAMAIMISVIIFRGCNWLEKLHELWRMEDAITTAIRSFDNYQISATSQVLEVLLVNVLNANRGMQFNNTGADGVRILSSCPGQSFPMYTITTVSIKFLLETVFPGLPLLQLNCYSYKSKYGSQIISTCLQPQGLSLVISSLHNIAVLAVLAEDCFHPLQVGSKIMDTILICKYDFTTLSFFYDIHRLAIYNSGYEATDLPVSMCCASIQGPHGGLMVWRGHQSIPFIMLQSENKGLKCTTTALRSTWFIDPVPESVLVGNSLILLLAFKKVGLVVKSDNNKLPGVSSVVLMAPVYERSIRVSDEPKRYSYTTALNYDLLKGVGSLSGNDMTKFVTLHESYCYTQVVHWPLCTAPTRNSPTAAPNWVVCMQDLQFLTTSDSCWGYLDKAAVSFSFNWTLLSMFLCHLDIFYTLIVKALSFECNLPDLSSIISYKQEVANMDRHFAAILSDFANAMQSNKVFRLGKKDTKIPMCIRKTGFLFSTLEFVHHCPSLEHYDDFNWATVLYMLLVKLGVYVVSASTQRQTFKVQRLSMPMECLIGGLLILKTIGDQHFTVTSDYGKSLCCYCTDFSTSSDRLKSLVVLYNSIGQGLGHGKLKNTRRVHFFSIISSLAVGYDVAYLGWSVAVEWCFHLSIYNDEGRPRMGVNLSFGVACWNMFGVLGKTSLRELYSPGPARQVLRESINSSDNSLQYFVKFLILEEMMITRGYNYSVIRRQWHISCNCVVPTLLVRLTNGEAWMSFDNAICPMIVGVRKIAECKITYDMGLGATHLLSLLHVYVVVLRYIEPFSQHCVRHPILLQICFKMWGMLVGSLEDVQLMAETHSLAPIRNKVTKLSILLLRQSTQTSSHWKPTLGQLQVTPSSVLLDYIVGSMAVIQVIVFTPAAISRPPISHLLFMSIRLEFQFEVQANIQDGVHFSLQGSKGEIVWYLL